MTLESAVYTLDTETVNTVIRAALTGLVALAFYMIKRVMNRFKKMEEETAKIEYNHRFVQNQLMTLKEGQLELQEDVTRLLSVILNDRHQSPIPLSRYRDRRADDEKGKDNT